jgi:cyclic beta-1,2-glucan synthetase
MGYVPGVRENGGQYTHAAVWTTLALAMMGHGNDAGSLLRMLNPIHLSSDRAGMERYRVEPYVVAADVWSLHPHEGRGGWTWYTGSASWLYRVTLENILGLEVGERWLSISPCIPADWPQISLRYQRGKTRYQITVRNPHKVQRGVRQLSVDGHVVEPGPIAFSDDGGTHLIEVVLG